MSITKEDMKLETIKAAYEREAALLKELCGCLDEERRCLIGGRIHELWALREKKGKICEDAEKEEVIIKARLRSILSDGGKDRPQWLIQHRKRINKLKLQILSRNAENMKIVQDTLGFLDGLIRAVTGTGAEAPGYGKGKTMSYAPKILSREA